MNKFTSRLLMFAALFATGAVFAERMDRPMGIQIGQRMTLKPYVGVSISYDTNVDGAKGGQENIRWTINPGLNLEYKSDNWMLIGNVFYQYNDYFKQENSSELANHSYGEDLTFRWTDSLPGERGWGLMLSERYLKTDQLDDLTAADHQYGRDRQEFKLAGALQRRFGYNWHMDVNASYYWLDYDNNNNQNTPFGLYGWERWNVGAELGYAASQWTDILLAASYQGYNSDNRDNNYYFNQNHPEYGRSSHSEGWTVQAGLGSWATDKITYRALVGWSRYQYKEGGASSDGATYTLSGNWDINATWKTMLLFTSYYKPSEMEYGSSQRIDSLSWGVAHSMVQGKLHGTFDIAYYRQGREYSAVKSYDYNIDSLTFRFGLNYVLNRYLSLFGTAEYRKSWCEESDSRVGQMLDYDRYLLTLGLRFTY